jgi:ABC-type lipoprotein export system ATPase subunit
MSGAFRRNGGNHDQPFRDRLPEILLVDEPTGNLDTKRSGEVGEVLKDLNRRAGITIVMVTHNPSIAKLAVRDSGKRDGRPAESRVFQPQSIEFEKG